MTKEEGYKETKVCPCVGCGEPVTVTKFATASKVLCEKCKNTGVKPSVTTPQLKQDKSNSKYGGDTKVCPCTKCGTPVTVTKFAAPSKVLCDTCKDGNGNGYTSHQELDDDIHIDMSKLDRSVIPSLEEYIASSQVIKNKGLRNIKCPACGHEFMKVIKVMDWSDFGLIIHYQCPKCRLLMSVSEQTKELIRSISDGELFDYSGNAIEVAGLSSVTSSRMSTTIQRLMKICKDNNIKIEGEKLPPYVWDNKRPVPVGYEIPKNDESIKVIEDTINLLESFDPLNNPMCYEDSKKLADKLKNMLKDDGTNEED